MTLGIAIIAYELSASCFAICLVVESALLHCTPPITCVSLVGKISSATLLFEGASSIDIIAPGLAGSNRAFGTDRFSLLPTALDMLRQQCRGRGHRVATCGL